MISSIRRRPRLFCLVILVGILVAGVAAIFRSQTYTSYAEIVVNPALAPTSAEVAVASANVWLRSDEAAQTVARLVTSNATNRVAATGAGWSPFNHRPASGIGSLIGPRGNSADLVRQLQTHVSVKRVADSYAIQIGFTASEPRLAATIANAFARAVIAHLRRTDPIEATLRLISTADPNVREDGPESWIIITVGALSGVVLGAMAAAIQEMRFSGLTSGTDVQSRLGLYHLGSVPLLCSVSTKATSPTDTVVDSPLSGFAESFRSILVATRQTACKDAKVFLITSALPDEGKSTTVACLARSAALSGETVVVVDCDNRRNGASAAFVQDHRTPGLNDLLRGKCTLDDALVQDARSGAWIIPIADDGTDISMLVGGEAMAVIFETLRDRFDRVFVDSPPILAMATTRSILPFVDASIMVVRWRATSDRAVKAALATVPDGYSAWSGAILTQVDIREQGRYGLSDASAFYQQSSKYYS